MTSNTKSKNAKKKPFRLTKNLVRLALNDGWTQKEVADKCRTQQSVVSAWNKGAKLANEQQLKPLLDVYGYKLRRNTFKVYWSLHDNDEKKFYRVEGKVILSQAFDDPRRDRTGKYIKKVPILKLVIHHQGHDCFLVVLQNRLRFRNTNEELECSDVEGVWNSNVLSPMNLTELIEFIDNYSKENYKKFPSNAYTLPFLLRKSLLNHGFSMTGIEEYPAAW